MTAQVGILVVNIITTVLIGIIAYFFKKTIERIDKHDEVLLKLIGDVQRLIGYQDGWNGRERRTR